MIRKQRSLFVRALKVFDVVIVYVSLVVVMACTSVTAEQISMGNFLAVTISVRNIAILTAFVIIWHLTMCSHKLYVSRRLSSFRAEAIDALKATSLGTLVLYLFSIIFDFNRVDLPFLLLFWANASVLILLGRRMLRSVLKRLRLKGMNQRNIVIAGAHHRAVNFARDILSRPELGYSLLGFVDEAGAEFPDTEETGYKMVANFDNFNEYLRRQMVDEVAICLPLKSHYQQAAHIASICEEHGIVVRFLSDVLNPKIAHTMTEQYGGHSLITFYTGNMHGGEVIAKLALDFILSFLLIIILSPLFLLAALLVKLTSEGPVFYVQNRLGVNKHHFKIYKFRTMYSDAEKRQSELEHLNEMEGAAFKIKNDPRITPVGKILRKMSVDELPQLLNVLKGEMSLVGPRPLPIRDYEGFSKDWHRRRFSVRPGITCLWQVSGRSNISFERWMELDMEYIDNWSLWLDIKILFRTISVVLRGSGAM